MIFLNWFSKTKFVAYTTRLSRVSKKLNNVCECSEETIHSFHSPSSGRILVGRFPKNVQEGYQVPVPSVNLAEIQVSSLTLVQILVTNFKIPDTDPSPSAVNYIFPVQKRANSSYFVPYFITSRPSYKCSKNMSSPKVDLNIAYANFSGSSIFQRFAKIKSQEIYSRGKNLLYLFMLPYVVGLSCNHRLVASSR